MTKKNNKGQVATKDGLKDLATKRELKGEIALVRFDIKDLEQRLDDKSRKYKDEILTGLDGVMKELQTMREENVVGTHQIDELNGRVDDHEKRIKQLESPLV